MKVSISMPVVSSFFSLVVTLKDLSKTVDVLSMNRKFFSTESPENLSRNVLVQETCLNVLSKEPNLFITIVKL